MCVCEYVSLCVCVNDFKMILDNAFALVGEWGLFVQIKLLAAPCHSAACFFVGFLSGLGRRQHQRPSLLEFG